MTSPRYSNKHLLIAAGVGATISFTVSMLLLTPSAHEEPVATREAAGLAAEQPANQTLDLEQVRKDLSTRFIGDPRTLGEKLRDFVAEDSIAQTIPIACKVIADLAENADALSDPELVDLYGDQTDSELKRVIAQVLSLRGDNHLLDKYVAENLGALHSDNPAERRKALQLLAKTHYVGAANALLPLLKDGDMSVKLDALLALRATGNESHIQYLEELRGDADPSVSWLANDAFTRLQYLSTKARTRMISADIAAELPSLAPGS